MRIWKSVDTIILNNLENLEDQSRNRGNIYMDSSSSTFEKYKTNQRTMIWILTRLILSKDIELYASWTNSI